MNWQTPTNWQIPFKANFRVIEYVDTLILCKGLNGTLYCTKSGDLSTMDRNGGAITLVYNFALNGYSGKNINRAIVLPSGTMLVALTAYNNTLIFMRSTNADYTAWEEVNTDWCGGMLLRSWDVSADGIVMAAEYPTHSPVTTVRLWKVTNDGRTWEVAATFDGRAGDSSHIKTIFHIHTVCYDPYTGYFWIGVGDSDAEAAIYKWDGTALTLIGSGSQYWRTVSFSFTSTHVIWGMDGSVGGKRYMCRVDKATETFERCSEVTSTIFVTQPIEGVVHPKYISNGDPTCQVNFSNDGYIWYNVYNFSNDPARANPPFRYFMDFVESGDGRFYGSVVGVLKHTTGEPVSFGTVIMEAY